MCVPLMLSIWVNKTFKTTRSQAATEKLQDRQGEEGGEFTFTFNQLRSNQRNYKRLTHTKTSEKRMYFFLFYFF